MAARISQEELAERARVSVESISALERGRRRAPYRQTIHMIAEALELSAPERSELEAAANEQRRRLPSGGEVNERANAQETAASEIAPLHNLSRPLTTFHGRERELQELAALLERHRFVTIVGCGGIGKTRLAVELGWTLVDRYADGVWFIDLAPANDVNVVARTLMTVLNLAPRPDGDELAALQAYCRRRTLLIVIDNCEHVREEAARVCNAILQTCPDVRIAATSREPLRIAGERLYRLPGLAAPPAGESGLRERYFSFSAMALFVDRATAVNSAFAVDDASVTTIAEICRRLDGIALAIELAASRAALLNAAEILNRLYQRLEAVSAMRGSVLSRQQTMFEALRWSYDLLDETERAFFRAVAVFAGGCTFEIALAFGAHLDESRMLWSSESGLYELLVSLADRSLIVAEPAGDVTRYRLLEPMRRFALELQIEHTERDQLQRAFLRWCTAFVEQAHAAWETLPSAAWSAMVEPELDNMRAALAWALGEHHDVAGGQRLASLSRRIWARFAAPEGGRWIAAALELVDGATPHAVVKGLWLADAHLNTVARNHPEALASARRFGNAHANAPDDRDRAEMHAFAGLALVQLGRSSEGIKALNDSIALSESLGATQILAHSVNGAAMAYFVLGDTSNSGKLFRKALDLFRQLENERAVSSVAGNLAELEFSLGNHETALRLGREAVAMTKDQYGISRLLNNVSAYLNRLNRFDEARRMSRDSLARCANGNEDKALVEALQHLAAAAVLSGHASSMTDIERTETAAMLLGFVDRRLAAMGSEREFTERQEYERTIDALIEEVGRERLAGLLESGSSWTDTRAETEARKL